jgi:hypothetical protein
MGANTVWPPSDWAGPDSPGSALFDMNAMTTTLSTLHNRTDVVFAELQFLL